MSFSLIFQFKESQFLLRIVAEYIGDVIFVWSAPRKFKKKVQWTFLSPVMTERSHCVTKSHCYILYIYLILKVSGAAYLHLWCRFDPKCKVADISLHFVQNNPLWYSGPSDDHFRGKKAGFRTIWGLKMACLAMKLSFGGPERSKSGSVIPTL